MQLNLNRVYLDNGAYGSARVQQDHVVRLKAQRCTKSRKEWRLPSGDNTLSRRQQWLLAAEQQGKRGSAGLSQSRQGEEKVGMLKVVWQGGSVVCSGDSPEKGKQLAAARWGREGCREECVLALT